MQFHKRCCSSASSFGFPSYLLRRKRARVWGTIKSRAGRPGGRTEPVMNFIRRQLCLTTAPPRCFKFYLKRHAWSFELGGHGAYVRWPSQICPGHGDYESFELGGRHAWCVPVEFESIGMAYLALSTNALLAGCRSTLLLLHELGRGRPSTVRSRALGWLAGQPGMEGGKASVVQVGRVASWQELVRTGTVFWFGLNCGV